LIKPRDSAVATTVYLAEAYKALKGVVRENAKDPNKIRITQETMIKYIGYFYQGGRSKVTTTDEAKNFFCIMYIEQKYKHNLTYRKAQIMAWKFDNNIPIYIQISNTLKLQIVTNQLKSGDKLPTVRDLAETAGVNPNTVQRALSDLETEGFVYSVRTTGRYVTDNEELIRRTRLQLAQNEVDNFVTNMLDLGFKQDELVKQLDDFLKGVSYE
jgi:DNA-binding transcriptional regulator YhcF (GntR family)